MLKKIVLILSLIFLSGCSVEYNLNIDDDQYLEDLTLTTSSTSQDYENLKNYSWPKPIDYTVTGYSEAPEKQDGVTYYDYLNNSNDNQASITYKYDMSESQIKKSAIIHNCFTSINIYNSDNSKTLQTSSGFECFDKYPPLENVTVNIKTTKEVVDNNADFVNNNTYTWVINKANASTKSIYLELNNSTTQEEEVSQEGLSIEIILIIIGVFIILLVVLIKLKNRKYRRN